MRHELRQQRWLVKQQRAAAREDQLAHLAAVVAQQGGNVLISAAQAMANPAASILVMAVVLGALEHRHRNWQASAIAQHDRIVAATRAAAERWERLPDDARQRAPPPAPAPQFEDWVQRQRRPILALDAAQAATVGVAGGFISIFRGMFGTSSTALQYDVPDVDVRSGVSGAAAVASVPAVPFVPRPPRGPRGPGNGGGGNGVGPLAPTPAPRLTPEVGLFEPLPQLGGDALPVAQPLPVPLPVPIGAPVAVPVAQPVPVPLPVPLPLRPRQPVGQRAPLERQPQRVTVPADGNGRRAPLRGPRALPRGEPSAEEVRVRVQPRGPQGIFRPPPLTPLARTAQLLRGIAGGITAFPAAGLAELRRRFPLPGFGPRGPGGVA